MKKPRSSAWTVGSKIKTSGMVVGMMVMGLDPGFRRGDGLVC
jgi:hypothetical protein